VVNFILSLVLARQYGAVGVAWGTFAGAILGVFLHFWQSMPRTQDLLRFDRARLAAVSILRPASVLLPSVALLALNRIQSRAASMQPVMTILCTVLTAAIAWRFVLNAEERRGALNFASVRLRRLAA
jgi:peptidoglycan biosynthesis protein MviN/MurJ (putative lipid II flippase)